jgi:UPF0755 protein
MPGPAGGAPRTVEIPGGAGLRAIASALQGAGVVSDARLFALYAALRGSGRKLRAGEYEFPPGAMPRDVLGRIERGETKRHLVTLPEGWTFAQMAEAIDGGIALATGCSRLRDPAFADPRRAGRLHRGEADTYAFTKGTRRTVRARSQRARRGRGGALGRGGLHPGLEEERS